MEKQKRYRSLLKKLRYVWHSRKRNFLKMAFTIRMKKTKKFYMYKRKAWVPKFWFNKKFRWRGRSDHKLKIWLSREYKIYIKKDLLKSIPARGTTSGHLLRDKRFKSGTEGYGRYAAIANLKKGSTTKIYRRRKIKLDSKLSKFIYKTSRFCSPNSYKNFGKEVLTKYNTIPFKLSMSRFIANKIFRSFYKHLSKKVLLGIQKKVKNKKNSFKNHMSFGVGSIKKLKKVFIQPLNKNINDLGIVSEKIKNYTNLRQKYEKTNLIRIKKKLLQKCEGEKSKRMVTLIEQRLDSTVLRLLHFKPVYSKYTLTRRNKNLKFHLSPLGLKNAKDTSKVSDSQEKKKVLVRAGGPVTSVTKSSQKTGTYAVPGAPRPALPLNEIAPSLRIAQEWTNNNYSFLQKLQDRNTSTLKSSKKVYVRKNPLVSYTPLQIKQMINHGHISVNGQKVKSGNFQIKSLDKISIKGFIQNLNLFRPSVVLDCTENKESQETNQRYKLLSKVAKMSQTFFKKKSLKKSSLWPSESSELYLKKGTLKKESASSAARSKTIVSKNTEVKNVKELASFPRKDAGPKGLLKTSLTRLGEKEVLNFPVGLISFKKKDLEHKIFCASDLKQDVKTTKKIRRGISLGDTYFNSESIAPYTKISQGKLLRNLNKLPQSTFGLEPVARCRWTPNFENKNFEEKI